MSYIRQMAYKNILHIDDDEDDLELFALAVNRISSSTPTIPINNAAVALEQLGVGTIRPDVIFLDLNMPMMNGEQFLSRIKNNPTLSNIPVIIFSTSANPATIRALKQAGATEFITKPSDFTTLTAVLKPYIAA